MLLPTPPKSVLNASHPMFLPIGRETTVMPMSQMDIRLFPLSQKEKSAPKRKK